MILPSEEGLTNISVAIDVLKTGVEISYNRKENIAYFQTGSPVSDGFQYRNYPVEDFILLESLGFLELDSANWEFDEWHYYWNNSCHPSESHNFKPVVFPGHFGR